VEEKINWLHLCDAVIEDKNNKLSLMGIFENINAVNFPTVHIRFFLVVNFDLDPGKGARLLKVEIENTENKNDRFDYQVSFSPKTQKNQYILELKLIKFDNPGKRKLTFSIEGLEPYVYFFDVSKRNNG